MSRAAAPTDREPVTFAAFPITTVGSRLYRMQALAAVLQAVAIVIPDDGGHDFTIDREFFAGLSELANVIREDYDAVQQVLGAEIQDRPAPAVAYPPRGGRDA
ncbi:MAG: hypothetical protein R2745_03640 [Vicinamibacterales bacterium]